MDNLTAILSAVKNGFKVGFDVRVAEAA